MSDIKNSTLFILIGDCVWGEWSAPKKVSPDTCGDGLQPRKRVGEVTRKYETYPDGEIKSPGGKCDDLRTKKSWEEDCPGRVVSKCYLAHNFDSNNITLQHDTNF